MAVKRRQVQRGVPSAIPSPRIGVGAQQLRGHLLVALGSVRTGEVASKAQALTLDERLKVSEAVRPLWSQLKDPRTRDSAWTWLQANVDGVMDRLSPRRSGWLPSAVTFYCSAERVSDVTKLFLPRLGKMAGGERELAKAVETLELCAASKEARIEDLRRFFAVPN